MRHPSDDPEDHRIADVLQANAVPTLLRTLKARILLAWRGLLRERPKREPARESSETSVDPFEIALFRRATFRENAMIFRGGKISTRRHAISPTKSVAARLTVSPRVGSDKNARASCTHERKNIRHVAVSLSPRLRAQWLVNNREIAIGDPPLHPRVSRCCVLNLSPATDAIVRICATT